MNVNLMRPYGFNYSPPRSVDVLFFSDKSDFLFEKEEEAVIKCQTTKRSYHLEWELCYNCVKTPFLKGECKLGLDNIFEIKLPVKDLSPALYDLKIMAYHSKENTSLGISTFGWKVDKFAPPVCKPDDFGEFWKTGMEKVKSLELDLKVSHWKTLNNEEIDKYNLNSACLPERYDPEGCKYDQVEVYKVEFNGFKSFTGGTRVHGWFAKPAGKGLFPPMLVLPGAGNAPRPAPVEHARHGYAALDIQVHCEPVDNPVELYKGVSENPFKNPALTPETMTHYSIYLNALQAVNALLKLPGIDADKLTVLGGSQGGRLTTMVSAMDKRVKAAISAITHFANTPYVIWFNEQNAADKNGGNGFSMGAVQNRRRMELESYYDVANFAEKITCPVLMNCGLIDSVSPASGVFAVYNRLQSNKKMITMPNQAHDHSLSFDTYAWQWLERQI